MQTTVLRLRVCYAFRCGGTYDVMANGNAAACALNWGAQRLEQVKASRRLGLMDAGLAVVTKVERGGALGVSLVHEGSGHAELRQEASRLPPKERCSAKRPMLHRVCIEAVFELIIIPR